MTSRLAVVLLLLAVLSSAAVDANAADNETQAAIKPRQIQWTTSQVAGSPEPPLPYTVERVFPQLVFKGPVHLLLGPDRKRYFLTEYTGRIVSFSVDQESAKTDIFLELGIHLHSLDFHPRFQENRTIYVFGNNVPLVKEGEEPRNQVLSFQVSDEDPPRVLPESQHVILEFESNGHNGGEAKFGPDGYLYITCGDGSSDSDKWDTGQDVSDLPSGLLRIDVDRSGEGRNYRIPDDNPLLHIEGARGEIWAYGFRNPWRFSFDKQSRHLYVGDVGQDLWEMVFLVQPGGNYGWSLKEGSHDFHPYKKQGPTPILPPLVEHHHTESRSLTGGHVYHGPRLPQLEGAYLYGDYETGKVWGLRHEGNQVTWHKELADHSLKVATFGVGINGEFLLADYLSGELYELVAAPQRDSHQMFPHLLSNTGLYSSTEELVPADGVIPYEVNAAQWCDGAVVTRHLALPGASQMTFTQRGAWQFPEGAVLAKTIAFPVAGANSSNRRVETQLLTLQSGEWAGYSYVWNDEQTDATLAPAQGSNLTLSMAAPDRAAGKSELSWRVVSRSECMVCHSRAAGFALGPRTAQMNRNLFLTTKHKNQLRVLEDLGVFATQLPDKLGELPELANPYDSQADVSARARAYLHANCSHCHVSAGGGNSQIVLSWETALGDMKLVGGRPLHADFGIPGAMLVAPGDPQRSVLFQRISRRGNGQMPPLATMQVDEVASRLMHQWIENIVVPAEAQADVDRALAEVQGESGVLSRWQVAGPLPRRGDLDSLSRASLPTDESITWKLAIGEGNNSEVTLPNHDQFQTETTWLARNDVIVPEQNEIQLTLAGNGPMALWLNGQRLVAAKEAQGRYDATLHKGRNRLLIEVGTRDSRNTAFKARFRRKSANETHEQFTMAALDQTGNPEAGRKLFFDSKQTQCAKCHRAGSEGGQIGPNLTGVAQRLTTHRIIESLLEPSRTVAPDYRVVHIELVGGRIMSGIVLNETGEALTIAIDDAREVLISKSEVEVLQHQPRSLMPEGLEKTISKEQFVDLVAFLQSLSSSEDNDQ